MLLWRRLALVKINLHSLDRTLHLLARGPSTNRTAHSLLRGGITSGATGIGGSGSCKKAEGTIVGRFLEDGHVGSSGRVGLSLLLLLFALVGGADDNDGNGGVLETVFGDGTGEEALKTTEGAAAGADD